MSNKTLACTGPYVFPYEYHRDQKIYFEISEVWDELLL